MLNDPPVLVFLIVALFVLMYGGVAAIILSNRARTLVRRLGYGFAAAVIWCLAIFIYYGLDVQADGWAIFIKG